MKFHVLVALIGMARAVQIVDDVMLQAEIKEAAEMEEECKDYQAIEIAEGLDQPVEEEDDDGLAQTEDEYNLDEPVDLSQLDAEELTEEGEGKNIKDTYKKSYGKSKQAIDKENKKILSTQKKCLNFVKKYKDHPKVCTWCQKKYKTPSVRWMWHPKQGVWYRYYRGQWHYWGVSKRGFTAAGWTWYAGYWHHGGYIYKWTKPYWYRFENKKWVRYSKKIPVKPQKPKYKVCRPVYKMVKAGTPTALSSSYVPRCKVGKSVYMYSSRSSCKLLGGKKVMQKRMKCKSGLEHKWKMVTKCMYYYKSGRDFDYKRGQLKRSSYKFEQCGVYKAQRSSTIYLHLFGQCHAIPNRKTMKTVFKSGLRVKVLSYSHMRSCKKGKSIKSGARLAYDGKKHYLYSHKMMQIINNKMYNKCQFNHNGELKLKQKDLQKYKFGPIIQ